MQKEIEIAISPERIEDSSYILHLGSKGLQIKLDRIKGFKIRKRSIDARSKHVVFRARVIFYIDEEPLTEIFNTNFQYVHNSRPVIIIGAGPAGLFAAIQCIEKGLKPIIIERGKRVQDRRRDLAKLNREGIVDEDSNYCFGEGGAGTYSDGKLFTRSNKRGDVDKVLKLFVAHGANEDILVNARPHIGTNKLPHIIEAIRENIIKYGGEVLFDERVVDITTDKNQVSGVLLASGEQVKSNHVIVATGHSARDIFTLFHKNKWLIEAKAFALGVRIEHPQSIIDQAQYHCEICSEHLPPAYYSLVEQVNGRGVFSFCMCPGGVIAPCATAKNEIVVNGWSPSKRNNPHANSGTVIQINLEDVPGSDSNPFAMLNFQQEIEKRAFEAGGGHLVAPAQRMIDFVEGRISKDLPENSYKPGTISADLTQILPKFVYEALRGALPVFGKKMKGYYTNDAILVAVESRTSSPIRIPRDKDTLQHPEIKGLYPCGEGAGYAGGIISAAIDGMNCADAIN
ncbi:NAD(P)/FAD-dependent oxidoreductase [Sphingobacterium sp. SRCM116780]|uniref:NAD(P)/FAD-dependent oxidoreductase n=1 Tax=Sphingobacterium sp. SRCM116780 TaxID=2907623 RepID=UPI001F1F1E7B|nr:NAD(P)/FAD-dependent oxidoreductase [Sphingobacterium sp. SRCM116780]UIR56058.1 NAD(P)/FAD-dependent oxidoreductase [Sphingobacterium sp. SRCM116780]